MSIVSCQVRVVEISSAGWSLDACCSAIGPYILPVGRLSRTIFSTRAELHLCQGEPSIRVPPGLSRNELDGIYHARFLYKDMSNETDSSLAVSYDAYSVMSHERSSQSSRSAALCPKYAVLVLGLFLAAGGQKRLSRNGDTLHGRARARCFGRQRTCSRASHSSPQVHCNGRCPRVV